MNQDEDSKAKTAQLRDDLQLEISRLKLVALPEHIVAEDALAVAETPSLGLTTVILAEVAAPVHPELASEPLIE